MQVGSLYMHTRTMASIACLLSFSGCAHQSHIIKKKILIAATHRTHDTTDISTQPTITILIHGTKLVTHSSYYEECNGKPTLKHVADFDPESSMYAWFKQLSNQAPDLFVYDHLYFFGWSGKLCVKTRDDASERLYDELVDLCDRYIATHHIRPKIQLVCHSHGGNIALTLARIHAQKRKNLSITALITLACPIQLSTKTFAGDPFFEHVYAFYSTFDLVQVIAPEIAHYIHNSNGELIAKKRCWFPFSARRFDDYSQVKQARIKMNNHAIMHSCFSSIAFLCTLPELLCAVDDAYSSHTIKLGSATKEVLCAIKSYKTMLAAA